MTTAAFAADPPEPTQPSPCYPATITRSEDMGVVLALLPQTKEVITEDGLSGMLTLKLDTVNVEVAGYGSSTKNLTAGRTYPGLASQDTQYIPKSITDNSHSSTLQTVNWQTKGDSHFTAVASYSGSAISSYVKGYTVTADYAGTVSRINLNKIRYRAQSSTAALGSPLLRLISTASPLAEYPAGARQPSSPVFPSLPLATRRSHPTSIAAAAIWRP